MVRCGDPPAFCEDWLTLPPREADRAGDDFLVADRSLVEEIVDRKPSLYDASRRIGCSAGKQPTHSPTWTSQSVPGSHTHHLATTDGISVWLAGGPWLPAHLEGSVVGQSWFAR